MVKWTICHGIRSEPLAKRHLLVPPNPLSTSSLLSPRPRPCLTLQVFSSEGIFAMTSSWSRALTQISPYTFASIGIAISIGVSVLGAAWFDHQIPFFLLIFQIFFMFTGYGWYLSFCGLPTSPGEFILPGAAWSGQRSRPPESPRRILLGAR